MNKGFTLIELLVVIAIIGILSAVVVSSVNTSRTKSIEAAIKQDLSGTRSQAELYYYANGNKYYTDATTNVCTAPSVNGVKSINAQITAAATAAGVTFTVNPGGGGGSSAATCNVNNTSWAAEVPLKTSPLMYCVDGTGFGTTTTGSTLAAGDVNCG